MQRYVIDGGRYTSRSNKYDFNASDSSNNVRSFRIHRNYDIKSFGNDIGCQYERPLRDLSRTKRKTHYVMEPNQRYRIQGREIGMSEIPNFVHNDNTRSSYIRPRPITDNYEAGYVNGVPQYLTLQKVPKFIYKRDTLSTWPSNVRPIETRYFVEDPKSRQFAYSNNISSTYTDSNVSGPIVEARYITEDARMPRLVTEVKCRPMVDASVGRASSRKKVTKIYMPEMTNTGTGSSDLSPYIAQLKAQHSQFQRVASTSCGYNTPLHLARRSNNFSTKLLPQVQLISSTASAVTIADGTVPSLNSIQVNTHTANVDDIPEKLVEKSQGDNLEPMTKSIKSTPGIIDVVSKKSTHIDKEPPSELVKVHDLESPNEKQDWRANSCKDYEEAEFLKIYENTSKNSEDTNMSKKSIAGPIPNESASAVRRRFEAIRKVVDRDNRKDYVSQATSRIGVEQKHVAISPGVTPQRSHSTNNVDGYRFDYQFSEPSSSPKPKGRHHISSGIYRFKLWGHRRNEIEYKQGKDQNVRKKVESQRKPLNIKEPEYAPERKKSRKLLFFGKMSKTKDKYGKDKNRQKITSARCDVPGVSLKIRGAQYLHQKRASKHLECVKNAWTEKFMHGIIDSTEDVHVRWNNKYFNTSSTTVFELMDSVYEGAGFSVKARSHESTGSVYKNDDKRVNFFQNIEAYMVYTKQNKTIQKPYKFRKNLKSTRSGHKWCYDNSEAYARKIELVLTANDITMFRHSTVGNSSSVNLNIDLPKNISSEEVFNITEYEDLDNLTDIPQKKMVTMDKRDVVVIPIAAESSTHCHRTKKYHHIVLRDSSILVPKRCDFISLLMQKTKWRSRNLHSQLQLYEDEDRKETDRVKILQEVYSSWLEKFNWFGKDNRSCHSDEIDFRGFGKLCIIEEETSVHSKSCPTFFDFDECQLTPKLSVADINHKVKKVEEPEIVHKPRENVAKKITDKIFSVFKKNDHDSSIRILPKDSVAVCRKRMKMAASLRKWQESDACDSPCSVPSHADKAGGIQWDITDIPVLSKKLSQEILNEPPSVLAYSSKKYKKKRTLTSEIDLMRSGVIPPGGLNAGNATASDEIKKETVVVLPVSDADSTEIKSTGVFCMPNTADPDSLYKQTIENDLNTFRKQLRALGTPLPLPDSSHSSSITIEKIVPKYPSSRFLYQAEYQLQEKAMRNLQNNKVTANDEPTKQDMRNLGNKLNTLSETTLKSIEVLSQVTRDEGEENQKEEINEDKPMLCVIMPDVGTTCENNPMLCIHIPSIGTCCSVEKKGTKQDTAERENKQIATNNENIKVTNDNGNARIKTCQFSNATCEPICSKTKAIKRIEESRESLKSYVEGSAKKVTKELESPRIQNPKEKSSLPTEITYIPQSSGCNCALKIKTQAFAERFKDNKSIPETFSCPKCSQCPDCTNVMIRIPTNSTGVSPMGSILQKNQRSGENNETHPSEQTQYPVNRSLAVGVSHDERDTSDGGIVAKLSPCTGNCDRYFSISHHDLNGLPVTSKRSLSKRKYSSKLSSKIELPELDDRQLSYVKDSSKHDTGKGSKSTASASTTTRDATEKKCVACIHKPWWLGGTGLLQLSSTKNTERKSEPVASPHSSEKKIENSSAQPSKIFGNKNDTATTPIYNMIEHRLKTSTAEEVDETYNLRDDIMNKFIKLDLPRIIEIDSKETILVGNKRKTPSTEEIGRIRSPDSTRSPKITASITNPPNESQNKYTPLEMHKDSDQIEISFKLKIGSGVTKNMDHSKTWQRYKTQPEVYVLGNQQDKTETVKAPNDVNIQIIIKPNSRRSEHDFFNENCHASRKPTAHNTDTYAVNRSATELSIHKEESESALEVKWEPTSEGKSTDTFLNSEGSSKEQSKDQIPIQRAIKPVSRTVASPFKVMYKSPLTDQEENTVSVGTEMMGSVSLADEQVCLGRKTRNDTTQDKTQVTTGIDSMKHYYRASSMSDDETDPSQSSGNITCSGPYEERVQTLNSKPKSKLIQTYTKIDEKHSCLCRKTTRPPPFQRSPEHVTMNVTKNQCINCDIEQELISDSYFEVVDTGTQYVKPPNCLMCFVKQYAVAPTVLEPVDFRMLNVEHPSPNIKNLQRTFRNPKPSSRYEEDLRPGVSSNREKVVKKVPDDLKSHKRIKRDEIPGELLQSHEMKKAVLELYAQKRVSQYGERLVAKLPKFVYGRETDIDKLVDRYCAELPEQRQ